MTLTFNGSTAITIPAGAEIYSDPVPVPTGGSGQLAISLHLPNAPKAVPGADGFGMPTFTATGNATTDTTGTPFTTRDSGYRFVAGVDTSSADPALGTVAALGNDRTMVRGTSSGQTWVEALPALLDAGGHPLPGGLVNASSVSIGEADDLDDVLNRCVLNQPNLRTVIVALGHDDLREGEDDSATVKRELTDLVHSTSATGIRNFRRADDTRVRVILMTVPPLDLAPDDPVEQARRSLNADIRTNYADYGAGGVLDIASALEDPANPAMTHPDYLDEDQDPNTAYYDTIARTVANEAAQLPPGAQL